MRRFITIAGLLLAPAAWGQGVSNLPSSETTGGAGSLPSTDTAPAMKPGQAAPYYPGAPVPQTPGTVSKAGEKKAPTGRYIYDDVSSDESTVEGPGETTTGGVPEVHIVKKGDTLWEISSQYFHNPWSWPKLWAYNPSITNPHWIYPGDVVRLAPAGQAVAQTAPTAAPSEAPKHLTRSGGAPGGLILRQTAFVEPGELEAAGKIVGSKEEKLMLATLDEAYVQVPKDKRVQPGDRLTVYKEIRSLKHPVSKKVLGHVVQIFGDVEVKSVTDSNIARVQIIDSTEDMQRGYRVGPIKRQFKLVEPTPAAQDQAAVVVGTILPRELLGTEMLIFVDRGKKDGVQVGNRYQVVRRGDGYQPLLNRNHPIDDRRFPREIVGEVIILDVREGVSTGYMLNQNKEIQIGDRAESHRGY